MHMSVAHLFFFTCPGLLLAKPGFLGSRTKYNTRSIDTEVALLSDSELAARADDVRGALKHLWSGYRSLNTTWGADEVHPITGDRGDMWGGISMLALDTLDTLWLAGLHKEFEEGEQLVSQLDLHPMAQPMRSSFFEITIRGLSGLLSAYALSGDKVLLEKAKELGDHLMQGFPRAGSYNIWPVSYIDVHNPQDVEVTPSFHRNSALLADVGSNVLEFTYLSEATGNPSYAIAAENVFNKLVSLSESEHQPLAPSNLDPWRLKFYDDSVSVGSTGDSYYEYLLKRYIQSGGKEHHLLQAWKRAMREMKDSLLQTSDTGLTYIAVSAKRLKNGELRSSQNQMEHLSCFVSGMLAMASHFVPVEEREDWWLPKSEEIVRTCYEMYRTSPSGLSPEFVYFDSSGVHASPGRENFRLRPETLESLFYLHRITGNSTYRDWSWKIFQAINRNTKTNYGFASVEDVTQVPVELVDSEETFMGAETLKYALLTQMPRTALSLEKFVLNTEAHPFPAAQPLGSGT